MNSIEKIAIIDMGTNTFHLMVAQVVNMKAEVIHASKKSVKIGEKGISDGFIAPEAIERAVNTIKEFCNISKALGVKQKNITAIATSAVRSAANKDFFSTMIENQCGVKINIINGESEAVLIYEGVAQSTDLGEKPCLIIDIGGGSVEFIICNKNNIYWLESFEIGGQRLMDQFHQIDPIGTEKIVELKEYLFFKLESLWKACEQLQPQSMIGASGSFDTIADIVIHQKKLPVDLSVSTSFVISKNEFSETYDQLIRKKLKERLAIPGMIPLRAEMIVVASILIDLVLTKLGFEQLTISTYALKEGAIQRVIKKNPLCD
jgi:exopolyphosphatase/guanosine-5'-triphosphate,3'-diphosphate pyrophosphatase